MSIENTTSKTMRWDPSEKYVTTISSFQNLIYFDELGNTDREIEIFLDQDDKVNLINYIWIENNSKLLIFGNFQYNYSSVMAILDYPSMQPASYHILNSREGRIDAIAYSSANSIVAFAMAYYEDPSNNYIYTLNTYNLINETFNTVENIAYIDQIDWIDNDQVLIASSESYLSYYNNDLTLLKVESPGWGRFEFSSNQQYLVTISSRDVTIRDHNSFQILSQHVMGDYIISATWSKDNSKLALGSFGGLYIFDIDESGKFGDFLEMKSREYNGIFELMFNSDNEIIITKSYFHLKYWDITSQNDSILNNPARNWLYFLVWIVLICQIVSLILLYLTNPRYRDIGLTVYLIINFLLYIMSNQNEFLLGLFLFIFYLIIALLGYRFISMLRKKYRVIPIKPKEYKQITQPKVNPNEIHVEGIGVFNNCCYNAARLKDQYCMCGRAIPKNLMEYFDN
ncbi:MAG: hypothetical protein OEY49_01645 [Candidatus Heimdallarchaeota archaeon]|nr:hypothetical protein [Candidatus Heimdallarchaeota archaeon]